METRLGKSCLMKRKNVFSPGQNPNIFLKKYLIIYIVINIRSISSINFNISIEKIHRVLVFMKGDWDLSSASTYWSADVFIKVAVRHIELPDDVVLQRCRLTSVFV